jgi:hypothetical protein
MLNPNPGGMARMRFTCVTKRSAARSYLLSLDRLGLEPAPATPTGWHECEDAPVLFCSAGSGADFMQPGRSDFHGWGGRAVTGPVAGTVKLCLFDARAGKTAEAVELRGVLEAGAWLVEVNGGEQVELKLDSGGKDGRKRGGRKKKKRGKQEPTIWRLPFPAGFERPANVTLRLRSAASNSRLLLDAWRWGTGQEGE